MADISIPGLNSKYNTQELIKGLMDVEKVKLTEMENSITELEDEKKVWQDLNRKISSLRSSSRTLFGFENPFNEKIVESSNERLLTATATREATNQELSFTVIKTAQSDRFISPSLDDNLRVPEGTYSFSIGEKDFSLRYRGGKLSDFGERIEKKSDGLLNVTVVKDTSDTQVILFESQKTGEENRLAFKNDALSWALDTGILERAKADSSTVQFSKELNNINYQKDSILLESDNSIKLKPESRISIPLTNSIPFESGMFLEYEISVTELDPEENQPQPPPEPLLPDVPDAAFRGAVVESFSSSAKVPQWQAPPLPEVMVDYQIGTLAYQDGDSPLPEIHDGTYTETVKIPLTGTENRLEEIILENKNNFKEITISNMRITDPRTSNGYVPVNSLSTAQNAILEFSGIQVERDTNNIDDLIPGVTLELNRADPDEEVDITVKPDIEKAKDEIIKFVYNYNQTMTQLLILSSDNSDIINEIEYFSDEEREKAFEDLGTFRGDITLMQIKNRLQRITASPYNTSLERELSMLSQIGISTNATGSGGSINASKLRGYLEINEELLDKSLQEKSPAIKELFGMDTDGDLVIDSGAGYEMDRFLNPYIQTGGILANKISLIDSNIDRTNDDIEDYKEYLSDYESDLKRKYGTMESMLNQLESSSSALDGFTNQQNNK